MPAKKVAKRPPAKAAAKKPKVTVVEDKSIKNRQSRARREFGSVLLFAASVLLGCMALLPGSNVWLMVHEAFYGLFGPCAVLWPIALLYISVLSALDRPFRSVWVKLLESAGLISLICGAVHIFTVGSFPGYLELFESGKVLACGGVIGGIFGAPLFLLFGKVGAAITIFLLIFVLFLLFTGITLRQVFSLFAPRLREKEQEETKLAAEPKAVKFSHKKPKFNIDIDLNTRQKASGAPLEPFPVSPAPAAAAAAAPKKASAPELDTLVSKAASAKSDEKGLAAVVLPFKPERGEQQKLYFNPPITLLNQDPPTASEDISDELRQNGTRLVDTLRSFGVETRIINICRGPAVTRYELQPSAGVKISRITSLADDIALNLAAAGVRIEAPIPNKAAVGIEVPNKTVSVVGIRGIIESPEFRSAKSGLTVTLGRDIAGNTAVADIGKMPHVLIAGATGSGKSVCINSIIISLLYKSKPEDVRFLMVDPKMVELGVYNGIPHLLVPVVTDPRKAAGALNWAVKQMLERYQSFADNNVRDIRGYNELARHDEALTPMPQIVIIIDELADLMMAAPGDVEDAICRLAQMARAAGMHLVIATQRPSVDVITGVIKANIPSRIAFAVSSQVDSRTILDMGGAEKLLGRGDMLFFPVGASKPVRVQGCFVSDKEVEGVIEYIKKSADMEYDENIIEEIEKEAVKSKGAQSDAEGGNEADPMLPQAIECVVEAGSASASFLQRRLKLGYSRAARIIDQMEARHIVGPADGSKPRAVLLTRQQMLEMSLNDKE